MPKVSSKQYKAKGAGLGEDIYEGSATFGRFMAWISLIISVIIGGVLIGLGIRMLLKKKQWTNKVTGNVVNAICNTSNVTNCTGGKDSTCTTEPMTSCDLNIEYTVGQEEYVSRLLMEEKTNLHKRVGEKVEVFYKDSDPSIISRDGDGSKKLVGWILVGFGIGVIIIASISFYVVQKFKFAAAASGVGSAFGMFNGWE